ncbi:hypothetical protein QBC37DRAFT_451740 [Rhypophila decipiens]|uniref:F-box domain-containing protein n=1 Tax=Rhypophila decipiens TaxID=261697 RepID=A0AAN6Y016_9PEZI|nr:hypothetical protein QBC37DRAFT_451740 [Rhypophila decipiens]
MSAHQPITEAEMARAYYLVTRNDEGLNDLILDSCTSRNLSRRSNLLQPFPAEALRPFTTPFAPREFSQSSIGELQKLPVEIATMSILHIDISTLVRFSHTCSYARAVVHQVPEYQAVLKVAGDTAFLAVLATRLSRFVTLAQLYNAVTSAKCTACGRWGELIFLPPMSRTCYECLIERKRFNVRSLSLQCQVPTINPRMPVILGTFDRVNLRIFPTGHPEEQLNRTLLTDLETDLGSEQEYRDPLLLALAPGHTVKNEAPWTVLNVPRRSEASDPWSVLEVCSWQDCRPVEEPRLVVSMVVPYLMDRKTGAVHENCVDCNACDVEHMPERFFLMEHFPNCKGALYFFESPFRARTTFARKRGQDCWDSDEEDDEGEDNEEEGDEEEGDDEEYDDEEDDEDEEENGEE